MGFYNETDIRVTASGDLSIDASQDLDLITGSGVLQQDIAFRLRTNYDEFTPHPDVGADLDELIGEPNTREVTKVGQQKIIRSLTHDNRIRNLDLYVRGVPIATDKTVYYVFVNNGTTKLNVTPDVIFDMINGMTNTPGA